MVLASSAAMISNKTRENRRAKPVKMSKNIERLYREGKCSECSVIVTRMDFAKILGKFTKVKIQYEAGSSTPKSKKNAQSAISPNSNARLKSNENGMVLIHRNAYSQHPVQELLNSKKPKVPEKSTRVNNNAVKDKVISTLKVTPTSKDKVTSTPKVNNILKENNRLRKAPAIKGKETSHNYKNVIHSNLKRYGIIFTNPSKKNNELKGSKTLPDLLPSIDKNILPSEEWCLDYLPKNGEPKEDKVYDRIAAELEDLMYNEKPMAPSKSGDKTEPIENKDDFPSIMDILNENPPTNDLANNQSNQIDQPNLESSDVEAMLLGKPSELNKDSEQSPMDVDNCVISNLMDVVQMNTVQDDTSKLQTNIDLIDNPNSPSILDEALQTGVEEHLPKVSSVQVTANNVDNTLISELNTKKEISVVSKNKENSPEVNINSVTHVVFKKYFNGQCLKSVTCPKNLKYIVELEGKSVEFLGAPKYVASLEDLRVLLQIVNETELSSLYVTH